jgi:DNA primase
VNVSHDRRPRWDIGDVLDRTDLASLLDELAQPAERHGPGRRWHCPAPNHDDHRASVTLHRDHRGHERWRCWSADHRGDAVDLVMVTSPRTRADAIDWLANRAGLMPNQPLPAIQPKPTAQAAPAKVMDPLVEHYVNICRSVIRGAVGRPVREWLHQRGITDETIEANRIGADPARRLLRRQKGLPYGAGIAATFPAFDPAGNLTYVQARYLNPDETGRKYDNPSAAIAPHPRLAFPFATTHPPADVLVVCEGLPDALTAAQAGFAAVALLGAQTPDENVASRIAMHAEQRGLVVTLVCDPDPAGRHVAETLSPLLVERGAAPTIIVAPGGGDLNDWALNDATWIERIASGSAGTPSQEWAAQCVRSGVGVEL